MAEVALPRRRLFFALWPPVDVQMQIANATEQWVKASLGRPMAPENFHVTLLFLGAVPDDRLADVLDAASRVAAGSFALAFDALTVFARARVLCLTNSAPPPRELLSLYEQLRHTLQALGFKPAREDFRPHITLARDVTRRRCVSQPPHLGWRCTEFSLVQSTPEARGSRYEVLGRWPLTSSE